MDRVPSSGYQVPACVAGLTFIVDLDRWSGGKLEKLRLKAREIDLMTAELEVIANRLISIHAGGETEQNWEKIDNGIKSFAEAAIKCPDHDAVVHSVRKSVEVFLTAISSERTRLLFTGLDALMKIANHLKNSYELIQEYFLHQLLRLCERTSKLVAERAKSCLVSILICCPGPIKFTIQKLNELSSGPNKMLRQSIVEALAAVVKCHRSLSDYEEAIVKIMQSGLQDAAENVRASSKQAFTTIQEVLPSACPKVLSGLPPAILKAVTSTGASGITAAPKPKASLSSFLASRKQGEGLKGPQRVVAKPPTPPSAQAAVSGDSAKRPVRMEPAKFSSSNPATKPSSTRMVRSMSSVSSIATSITDSAPIEKPATRVSADDLNVARLKDSLLTGKLPAPEPDAKSSVVAFVVGVKSPEWDKRLKAILDFGEALTNPKIQDFILSSKSTISRLFEILVGGLLDVHFKVVFEVLRFGAQLLKIVPINRLPDPSAVSLLLCLRTFGVLTNIQFKAKQAVLDAASELLAQLETWINDAHLFIEVLMNSSMRQDAPIYVKSRVAVLAKLDEFIRRLPSCIIPNALAYVRKLGPMICDPDVSVGDLACSIVMSMQTLMPDEDLSQSLSPESKTCLIKFLERRNALKPVAKVHLSPIAERSEPCTSHHASPMKICEESIIVIDEEITLRIRPSAPGTPLSKAPMIVDFDTPRAISPHEDASSDEEISHQEDLLDAMHVDDDSVSGQVESMVADVLVEQLNLAN